MTMFEVRKDQTKHMQMAKVIIWIIINYMLLGHWVNLILNQTLMIF